MNTNLATNSGFQVFDYVQDDSSNGAFTQTPGVGGIVAINWKKIARQSQSFTGTSTLVSGGFSNKVDQIAREARTRPARRARSSA